MSTRKNMKKTMILSVFALLLLLSAAAITVGQMQGEKTFYIKNNNFSSDEEKDNSFSSRRGVNISSNTTIELYVPNSVGNNTNLSINGGLYEVPGKNPVKNAIINISFNDMETNTETDNEGKFYHSFFIQKPLGDYLLVVSFIGDEHRNGSVNKTIIRVKLLVMINITALDSIVVGENLTINGTLKDEDGSPLDENLSINFDDTSIGITQPVNGSFSLKYIIPSDTSAGNHTITVEHLESLDYAYSSVSRDIKVKRKTSIIFPSKFIYRNKTAKVNGTLIDNVGCPVNGLEVNISWNGENITTITDDDGLFLIEHQVQDYTLGSRVNVTVFFNGSDFYTSSKSSAAYTVVAETKIIMDSKNVFRDTKINITGRLVDDLDIPLKNMTVNVTLENNYFNPKTDGNGNFSVSYTVAKNHSLGNIPIYAEFYGFDYNLSSDCNANYTVVSTTTIIMETKNVLKGDNFTINGEIVDDQNMPVSNLSIKIFFGTHLWIVESNSSGFSFNYSIPSDQNVGAISVKAVFDGNFLYIPSENETKYIIFSDTKIVNITINNLVRGESLELKGKLLDVFGTPIDNMFISMSLEDISITNVTSSNGTFRFEYLLPENMGTGDKILVLSFDGTNYLNPSEKILNVTIKGKTLITIDAPNKTRGKLTCTIMVNANREPIQNKPIVVELILDAKNVIINNQEYQVINDGVSFNLTTDIYGNASFILEGYTGKLIINVRFEETKWFTSAYAEKNVEILKPGIEKFPWIFVFISPIVIVIIFSMFFYRMKKKHVTEIEATIKKAKRELVSGNPYVKTIFRLYQKLCFILKKYNFLRKDFETFREFEQAIRKSLSIDREALNNFLRIIEETLYSKHRIGEEHRDKAVKNFRIIEKSLKEVK